MRKRKVDDDDDDRDKKSKGKGKGKKRQKINPGNNRYDADIARGPSFTAISAPAPDYGGGYNNDDDYDDYYYDAGGGGVDDYGISPFSGGNGPGMRSEFRVYHEDRFKPRSGYENDSRFGFKSPGSSGGGLRAGEVRATVGDSEDDDDDDNDDNNYDSDHDGTSHGRYGDPYEREKRFLLERVKEKFLEIISPLTNFVREYINTKGLGEGGGPEASERLLNGYIVPRHTFMRSYENNDWAGLVDSMVTGGGGGGRGDLLDAVMSTVYADEIYNDMLLSGDYDNDKLDNLKRFYEKKRGKEARELADAYGKITSGSVTFCLDPFLLRKAESTLSEINSVRPKEEKIRFTLWEVMKSESVMCEFVKYMVFKESSSNMFRPKEIQKAPYVTDNGGYSPNVVNVTTRASRYTMGAASTQYKGSLVWFQGIRRSSDGTLRHVTDTDYEPAGMGFSSLSADKGKMVQVKIWDHRNSKWIIIERPPLNSYEAELAKNGTTDYASTMLNAALPVEKLENALAYMRHNPGLLDSVLQGTHAEVDKTMLSYRRKNGDLVHVDRSILGDRSELENLTKRGRSKYIIKDSEGNEL